MGKRFTTSCAVQPSEGFAVLSAPLLVLSVCAAGTIEAICRAIICVTLGRIAAAALHDSRSVDRSKIIHELTAMSRRLHRPWWRRRQ
ncbi:hypothetical protein ACFO3J_29290 [Streptomyces polygonati]|uniref:Secreted protein n=1 Tax=Streptomyces polygonati TaxID=1617087 RepID=A0ABV8HZ47_9ACTN